MQSGPALKNLVLLQIIARTNIAIWRKAMSCRIYDGVSRESFVQEKVFLLHHHRAQAW
jgi:hypothetical protein